MKVPRFVVGVGIGVAVAALAPRLVASARAQTPSAPAPAASWTPPVRYQYHVINTGWSSAQVAETIFNGLGQDGWRVVAESGSYVTFERSWATH